jgi:hypothetical protein
MLTDYEKADASKEGVTKADSIHTAADMLY